MNRFDIILEKEPPPSMPISPYFMGIDLGFSLDSSITVGHFEDIEHSLCFYVDSHHIFSDLSYAEIVYQIAKIRTCFDGVFFGRCDHTAELDDILQICRIPCDHVNVNSSWLRDLYEQSSYYGIRLNYGPYNPDDPHDHSFAMALSLAIDYAKDKTILNNFDALKAPNNYQMVRPAIWS